MAEAPSADAVATDAPIEDAASAFIDVYAGKPCATAQLVPLEGPRVDWLEESRAYWQLQGVEP